MPSFSQQQSSAAFDSDVPPEIVSNFYELTLNPVITDLYRGQRPQTPESRVRGTVYHGRHVYSLRRSDLCPSQVKAEPAILREFIHSTLRQSLEGDHRFFDLSDYALSGSIAGDLLYLRDAESVYRQTN